jgi:hypothetical protein
VVTTWLAPYFSLDSLVVDRRTLAPLRETLVNGEAHYDYVFNGGHVTGTVAKHDSLPRRIDRQFATAVFAFNEVNTLIRSMSFQRGLTIVVPLFSEVDADVERDTITVLDRVESTAGAVWHVRFADPAITTEYIVDERTRSVLEYASTNRKSGTVFRVSSPR